MFNFFKKKESLKPNINFHSVTIKSNRKDLYIGQFLKIEAEEIADKNDNDLIENVNYYFSTFNKGNVALISEENQNYCEQYNYGVIRSISNEDIEVLIICSNGYLQRYDIEIEDGFKNGDAFIIKNGIIYNNNVVIGKITDKRYNNDNIILNTLDSNKLVVFIQK